jgi:hypothetical protein
MAITPGTGPEPPVPGHPVEDLPPETTLVSLISTAFGTTKRPQFAGVLYSTLLQSCSKTAPIWVIHPQVKEIFAVYEPKLFQATNEFSQRLVAEGWAERYQVLIHIQWR